MSGKQIERLPTTSRGGCGGIWREAPKIYFVLKFYVKCAHYGGLKDSLPVPVQSHTVYVAAVVTDYISRGLRKFYRLVLRVPRVALEKSGFAPARLLKSRK